MEFVLEQGVAKPSSGRGRKPTSFPLGAMDVGVSFLIKLDPANTKLVESWRRKLRVAVKHFTAQYGEGYKFETAVVVDKEDAEKTGLRVYRTK